MTPSAALRFTLIDRHPLRHAGDVCLLAATESSVWVEELYGDGWLAQHRLEFDGAFSASVDEDEGRAADLSPLPIPPGAIRPQRAWSALSLNHAGPRRRGLREEDRLLDLLPALPIADKLALAAYLGLPTPSVLGLTESFVLAESPLTDPADLLVCRRLRAAVVVPRQIGPDGLPFDYDTVEFHVLHPWTAAAEAPTLDTILAGLPGVPLVRPMDCLRLGNRLIVAEGGESGRLGTICVLAIDGLPPPDDPEQALLRKLYG